MIARTAPAADPARAARPAAAGDAKGASAFGALMEKFAAPAKEAETPATAETPADPVAPAEAPPAAPLPNAIALAMIAPQAAAPAAPEAVTPSIAKAPPRAQPTIRPATPEPAPEAPEPARDFAVDLAAADPVALPDPLVGILPAETAPHALHKGAADPAPLPAAADSVPATGSMLAAQAMETRLDVVRDAQWIDRAARDIAQLANSEGRLRFRLDPEQLGSLQIDLANGADGLSLRMTAETEAARAILADAQPRLVAEARAQGVRIAEAHVDLGQGGGQGRNAPPPPAPIARDRPSTEVAAPAAPAAERFA